LVTTVFTVAGAGIVLDALAGNTGANSIAELSLSPLFPRSYNSIYKAIKASFNTNSQEMNNK
jgi:hypothetical protein